MEYLAGEGLWLKGNLHTHTTESDGKLTPRECIALYREKGYDFLCITDHHRTRPGGEEDGMLILGGAELNNNNIAPRVCWHITGAGVQHSVDEIRPTDDPQKMVDALKAAGAFVTLAHPAWSLMTDENLRTLQGYDAIEIYNGVSDFYSGRGDSSVQLDTLAAGGRLVGITAADDTHFYGPDAGSGWVVVRAAARTREAVLEALFEKRYYATQGPALYSLQRLADGRIRVETSPLERILFYTDSFFSADRVHTAPAGGSLTQAEYAPSGIDTWVRVEGIDAAGKRVWSNYIDLTKKETAHAKR
ncbi:MAG: hypothetical protein IJ412_00265 [Oscillospiraceae bacterium]|nr:hypothetical protein [Oscillospiraceae bacterium]